MTLQPSDVLVWLQTTVRRDASQTIKSIERSDIGGRFLVVEDKKQRQFPRDYIDLQNFWHRSWLEMADAARVRNCSLILRLEDDIVVNRHILHNVCRWKAPESPLFGLGTLFSPDYWLKKPQLFVADKATGAVYRNNIDVEGAQGQLVATSRIEALLAGVPQAIRDKGFGKPHHQPSFDWSLSRAAWPLGLRAFVHQPALVDLHAASLQSQIDLEQHQTNKPHPAEQHYWGHKSFQENWKAA